MITINLADGIRLHGGVLFDYAKPDAGDIPIEAIAAHLSKICRFAGGVKHFYSVAQHCVLASQLVAPEFAFDALMHDTAEAVTNDIPRPAKLRMGDEWKKLEFEIESSMSRRFGFTYPLSPEVRRVDDLMLKLEKQELLPWDDSNWAILDYIGDVSVYTDLVDLSSWPPERAEMEYLDRFEELRPC